jgi:hypothetical protein
MLKLTDSDTKVDLWENPCPGGCEYLRPISHTRTKDSETMMMDWVVTHELDIRNLTDKHLFVDGKHIVVKYEVYPTMLDGKMRKACYTAGLQEANRQGFKFKNHGSPVKLNYSTCAVRTISPRLRPFPPSRAIVP